MKYRVRLNFEGVVINSVEAEDEDSAIEKVWKTLSEQLNKVSAYDFEIEVDEVEEVQDEDIE